MMNPLNLNTRKRAASTSAAFILLIGLMVPAAAITHFVVLPTVTDEVDGTAAENITLSQINELANVISGSAIDINVQNGGKARITLTATKIRCANGTEFPGSSWRTPWYPEEGIVKAGESKIFTFVFDDHPASYGSGTLQLVITFYVDDNSGNTFDKTIPIDMTGGTAVEDVTLSQINELANVISGSAVDINVQNGGKARITLTATKVRCANGTEFPGSSWRTPWYPEDGIIEPGQTKCFTFVFDHHPAAYGPGTLQLVITFCADDDPDQNFSKSIVIAN